MKTAILIDLDSFIRRYTKLSNQLIDIDESLSKIEVKQKQVIVTLSLQVSLQEEKVLDLCLMPYIIN